MFSTKALLIASSALALSVSSQLAAAIPQSKIPDSLQVPSQQPMRLNASAKGVQIYVCEENKTNKQFKWVLKAPEAILFDPKTGKRLGKHYAGPTWEALDGSKVVGKVKNKASAPNGKNIPWLLLTAKSHTNEGLFSHINYIQRVDTKGGSAPSAGCDYRYVGKQTRISYSADYYFFGTVK
jgi:Protein of unknown function (DUF3455)